MSPELAAKEKVIREGKPKAREKEPCDCGGTSAMHRILYEVNDGPLFKHLCIGSKAATEAEKNEGEKPETEAKLGGGKSRQVLKQKGDLKRIQRIQQKVSPTTETKPKDGKDKQSEYKELTEIDRTPSKEGRKL
ncbi:hypothetical protein JTB14_017689 [Gonioctena quinquepunctata]|nr:hypothetical protein JTB14_017689 [Gonioctena quinquepunctata]